MTWRAASCRYGESIGACLAIPLGWGVETKIIFVAGGCSTHPLIQQQYLITSKKREES